MPRCGEFGLSSPPVVKKAAMSVALVLFAHGARDPQWADPLRRIQRAILAAMPDARVEIAFLEFMTPTLPDCVSALASQGVARVEVLPMFIAQGGHLKRDLPEMLAALRQRFPGIELALSPAVGESESVIAAMAAVGEALLRR